MEPTLKEKILQIGKLAIPEMDGFQFNLEEIVALHAYLRALIVSDDFLAYSPLPEESSRTLLSAIQKNIKSLEFIIENVLDGEALAEFKNYNKRMDSILSMVKPLREKVNMNTMPEA